MSLLIPTTTSEDITSLIKKLPLAEQKRILSYLNIYTKIVDNPTNQFGVKNTSYDYFSNVDATSKDFQSLYELFSLIFQFTDEERNSLINDFKSTAIIKGLQKIKNKPNKKKYSDAEALQIALETIEETRNEDQKDKEVCSRY